MLHYLVAIGGKRGKEMNTFPKKGLEILWFLLFSGILPAIAIITIEVHFSQIREAEALREETSARTAQLQEMEFIERLQIGSESQ